MPRGRRGASAVTVETGAERGFAMRLFLYSPKDTVAGALAFAAVSAIVTNALFLQAGHHPAPMFGSVIAIPATGLAPANPVPRPRPVELAIKPADSSPSEPKPAELKAADPLTSLVKATSAPPAVSNVPRPPAPIPASTRNDTVNPTPASHRVAAVQRALTEYGYGQLKPTGTIGTDTQAAIQRFEREHKIPVTGQMSDRLVRDLAAMVGHPID
jgi:Putative peptidoglycan binding domain